MTVLVSPTAIEAVDAAARRLEGEHPGYGPAIADLFAAAVAAIGTAPRRFPRVEDGPDGVEFREAYIARFEYRVIFAVRDVATAEVVTVVHARRKPGSWVRGLPDNN